MSLTRTKLPRSTATNAYDLLTDVATAITQEPKRFDMDSWLVVGRAIDSLYRRFYIRDQEGYGIKSRDLKHAGRPNCGTVGCLAGWIETLKRPATSAASLPPVDIIEENAYNRLRTRDSVSFHSATYELFHDVPKRRSGTRAYARLVLTKLRAYQAKYAERLKATPV